MHMKSPHSSLTASLLSAAPLCALAVCITSLTGCGAGTAAAVSGGGGSSSGGNAPPSMSGFTVLDPKLPAQARVRFVLSDAEANPAHVEIFYQAPGQPAQPLTQTGSNPAVLATSSQGVEHLLPWNFAAEPALPDDAHFVDDVRVFARIAGGIQEIVLGANAANIGLGNDAPVVTDVDEPSAETAGIVLVEFTVADSSHDIVSVKVEYDLVGDVPDASWQLARPAGEESTPALAIRDVVVDDGGTDLRFFWDTNVDLAELERDVRVRFTAVDPVVQGASVASAVFRVDNNAEPIATISDGLLILNPDQRAGIPIPYTVRDEESDEVQVVFQWKRPNEDFPLLPDTVNEINAILADPVQRRERHICTEYPTWVEGRVVPIDSTTVRLPELATSASSILAHGLVGRELEILRASNVPKPIAATWPSNPLTHPVAALPVGDGIEALVLDLARPGAWRLRQIELATGVVTRALVPASPGELGAVTFERDQTSVLVASSVAGDWQVARVRLSDGSLTPLVAFDGSTEQGNVRGIASLGTGAALITLGGSLVRLDWLDPQNPTATTILDGLETPWGLVLDPLNTNQLYLAERDAETSSGIGRVQSIRLDTLERRTLLAQPVQLLDDVFVHAINRPQALALDRSGTRLLAITQRETSDGTHELLAVDLNAAGASRAFDVRSGLPAETGSVALGDEELLLLALTSEDDLAVGGGIEQRRTIEEFELAHRDAHVTAAFSPALASAQPFRIRIPSLVGSPTPFGARDSFVWNSADLAEGGGVQFRAVPMDAERGVDGATEAAKVIRSPLDAELVTLGNVSLTSSPFSVAAADLDGDGDLDVASANYGGNTLTVFLQASPGVFASTPLTLGNESVTNAPASVIAADLDGDGDLDLASANTGNSTLTVFFQESPGVFGATPLSLGDASVTGYPFSITAADLDCDGDLDLASANTGGQTLAIFFQESPGVFGSTPLSLGGQFAPSSPYSVIAADLDGDGDLDLASAHAESNWLTIFFQESPRVFSSTPLILGDASVTFSPFSVAAADLDGDGDLDLASANLGSHTLTVFFQEGPGVFGSTPLSLGNASVTNAPVSVTASDFDGDGDLDLASANQGSDTLTVFFQASPGVFDSTPLSLGKEIGTEYCTSIQ